MYVSLENLSTTCEFHASAGSKAGQICHATCEFHTRARYKASPNHDSILATHE